MPLEFRTVPADLSAPDVTLLVVAGEIDIATAPQLRDHLGSLPDRHTVVDLSGVTLLGAAGLTVLLDLKHRLDRADARLLLAAAPIRVVRVLAATRLTTALPGAHTVRHAIALIITGPTGQPARSGRASDPHSLTRWRPARDAARGRRPWPRPHARS
jgi:anti-anti-sigma factor